MHPGAGLVAIRVDQQKSDADKIVALAEDGGTKRNDLADERLGRPTIFRLRWREVPDRDAADSGFEGSPAAGARR
jgi:hypothetical protein